MKAHESLFYYNGVYISNHPPTLIYMSRILPAVTIIIHQLPYVCTSSSFAVITLSVFCLSAIMQSKSANTATEPLWFSYVTAEALKHNHVLQFGYIEIQFLWLPSCNWIVWKLRKNKTSKLHKMQQKLFVENNGKEL